MRQSQKKAKSIKAIRVPFYVSESSDWVNLKLKIDNKVNARKTSTIQAMMTEAIRNKIQKDIDEIQSGFTIVESYTDDYDEYGYLRWH